MIFFLSLKVKRSNSRAALTWRDSQVKSMRSIQNNRPIETWNSSDECFVTSLIFLGVMWELWVGNSSLYKKVGGICMLTAGWQHAFTEGGTTLEERENSDP